jgi:hypothetical protein
MTYREAAMNLDQALGVYSLMEKNIESGAIQFVSAARIIREYATYEDYLEVFTAEELAAAGVRKNPMPPTAWKACPSSTARSTFPESRRS